jgi:hypothetical protein
MPSESRFSETQFVPIRKMSRIRKIPKADPILIVIISLILLSCPLPVGHFSWSDWCSNDMIWLASSGEEFMIFNLQSSISIQPNSKLNFIFIVVILTNWMSNWIESLVRNEWLIWISDRWATDHLQMWKFSLVYEMNADLNHLFDSLDLIVKYASQFIHPYWIQRFHNPVEKLMLIVNRLTHQLIFEFRDEIEIEIEGEVEVEGWDLLGSEADRTVCEVNDSWKVYCHLFNICDVQCPVCAMMLSTRTTIFFWSDLLLSSFLQKRYIQQHVEIAINESCRTEQDTFPGNCQPWNPWVFRNNINRCFSITIVRLRWSETFWSWRK